MRNSLLKKELLAVFKDKRKLLIPIIAIFFIPVLYSGMFLWAFWDPYGHLENLPVAIVNEDKGATLDGEEIELGNELISKLTDSKDFKYKTVSRKDGYQGLTDQKYYMLVEIPNDFSENATTLMDDSPQKLNIIFVPNEGYNFLSSQIGSKAVDKIKASVAEKITETYAETMFDKVKDLSEGMTKASDGANKLNKGATKLQEGSDSLQSNLSVLASKSIDFKEGVNKANTGFGSLKNGVGSLSGGLGQLTEGHQKLENASEQLAKGNTELAEGISKAKGGLEEVNKKMPDMIAGTKQIQDGTAQLSSSLNQWQEGAQKLSGGMSALQANLEGIIAQMPEDSPQRQQLEQTLQSLKSNTDTLASSASELAKGADKLNGSVGQLKEGQENLNKGITQLAEGSNQLGKGSAKILEGQKDFQAGMNTFGEKLLEAKEGSEQLADGAAKFSGGLSQLSDGSVKLSEGTDKLAEGSAKLAEGNGELSKGSKELATKLSDGAERASSVNADDKTYDMMAKPVKLKSEKMNEVPNYGTGFTPYFLSLSLFVGALLMTIVFPIKEPVEVPKSGFSWFIGKTAILYGIGVVQSLIAATILIEGLGLKVQSVPLFLLFTVITSLTFISIIQFLVTVFGDPGRFIAILILILQLTSSAGTFPIELVPNFFQQFTSFLPMTYSVHGLKEVISIGDFTAMWHNAGTLAIFDVAFAMCTFMYFKLIHKRQFKTLAE